MKLKLNCILTITLLISISCANDFYSKDAYATARTHKRIAIMPPSITILLREKVDSSALKEVEKKESLNIQREIYLWMLMRKKQWEMNVEIQDYKTTNITLQNSAYSDSIIRSGKICELLNVDGIITTSCNLTKPMSEEDAFIIGFIMLRREVTNILDVSMCIHDGKQNKMIWNYNHRFTGLLGSTPVSVVDEIMKAASQKMPYIQVLEKTWW